MNSRTDESKYAVMSSGALSVLEDGMMGRGSTPLTLAPSGPDMTATRGGGVGNPGTRDANMASMSAVFWSPTIMYQIRNNLCNTRHFATRQVITCCNKNCRFNSKKILSRYDCNIEKIYILTNVSNSSCNSHSDLCRNC